MPTCHYCASPATTTDIAGNHVCHRHGGPVAVDAKLRRESRGRSSPFVHLRPRRVRITELYDALERTIAEDPRRLGSWRPDPEPLYVLAESHAAARSVAEVDLDMRPHEWRWVDHADVMRVVGRHFRFLPVEGFWRARHGLEALELCWARGGQEVSYNRLMHERAHARIAAEAAVELKPRAAADPKVAAPPGPRAIRLREE